MSTQKAGPGETIDVSITTQGSETAVNALNSALKKMGDLLANVNSMLNANDANLIRTVGTAGKLAATIDAQVRIASTILKAQANNTAGLEPNTLANAGMAQVGVGVDNHKAKQVKAAANSASDRALVEFRDQIVEGKATSLLRAKQMISEGTITSSQAKIAAQSVLELGQRTGNLKTAERASIYIRAIEKLDMQIADEKKKALKLQQENNRKSAKAERDAEALKTPQGQYIFMQQKADAAFLNSPNGAGYASAAARAQTTSRAATGFKQLQIEEFARQNAGQLTGPNRRRYFDGSVDFTQQADGRAKVQGLLDNAQLHQAYLRSMPVTGQSFAQSQALTQDKNKLNVEIKALREALNGLTKAQLARTPTAQSLQRLAKQEQAQGKLDGIDLTAARNLAKVDLNALPVSDLKRKQSEISAEIRKTDAAMSHAKTAQNKTARQEAQDLNKLLQAQLTLVEKLREADKTAKVQSTAKYQFTQMAEKAGLNQLGDPNSVLSFEAAARASVASKLRQGQLRQKAEQDLAALSGQGGLTGPRVGTMYIDSSLDNSKVSAAVLSDKLEYLKRHQASLELARQNPAAANTDIAGINAATAALKAQAEELKKLLTARKALDTQNNLSTKGFKQERAAKVLAGFDLTDAKTIANKSIAGLTGDKAVERTLELTRALADARKAYNLAVNAGDKAAQDSAKKLELALRTQQINLNAATGDTRKQAKAKADEEAKFNRLNAQTFRTTDLSAQISGAKTLLELDKLKRVELDKQLKAAKALQELAIKRGDAGAEQKANKLIEQYSAEAAAIRAKENQIKNEGKAGQNLAAKMSPEGQGAAFLNRMTLMKDYMMMGGIMGSISGAYSFVKDFESSLKQTQAIAQGTNQQMQSLKTSIIDVSDASRFSAIELTEVTTSLAQAGFSMSEIERSLRSVATLATATGSGLKDSVDIVTSVMGAFKMSASTMPDVVNQITQAMNMSKLDVPKFMLATQYAGNAASDLGVTFKEMLSATAAVSNTGIRSGSTMGTGMRQLMADLATPTDKMKKKMQDLGLTFADLDVRTNGLTGVMKNLKAAGFSTADAFGSFELRAAAYYVALGNNLDSYDEMYANMDNGTAAMDAQEIQMDSLAAQSDRMTNQFRVLADVVGKDLSQTLKSVFGTVADFTALLSKGAAGGVISWALNIGVMTVALGVFLLACRNVITVLRGVMGVLAAMRASLVATAATATLTGKVMSLSLGWVFAISAGIAIAITAYQKFGDSSRAAAEAAEEFKTKVASAKERIEAYGSSIEEIQQKLKSLSARSVSLAKDQEGLAVEFDEVRKKALELGIDLKDRLMVTVKDLTDTWEQLRLELSKQIVIDMVVKNQAQEGQWLNERQTYASDKNQRRIQGVNLIRSSNILGALAGAGDSKGLGTAFERATGAKNIEVNLQRIITLMSSKGKSSAEDYKAVKPEVDRIYAGLNATVLTELKKLERLQNDPKVTPEQAKIYAAQGEIFSRSFFTHEDSLEKVYADFVAITNQVIGGKLSQNAQARAEMNARTNTERVPGYDAKLAEGIANFTSGTKTSEYSTVLLRNNISRQAIEHIAAGRLLTHSAKIAEDALKAAVGLTDAQKAEAEADIADKRRRASEEEGKAADLMPAMMEQALVEKVTKLLELNVQLAMDRQLLERAIARQKAAEQKEDYPEALRLQGTVERIQLRAAAKTSEIKGLEASQQSSGDPSFGLRNEQARIFKIESEIEQERIKEASLLKIAELEKRLLESTQKLKQKAFELDIKRLNAETEEFKAQQTARDKSFKLSQDYYESEANRPLAILQARKEQMALPSNERQFTSFEKEDLDRQIAAEQESLYRNQAVTSLVREADNLALELELQGARYEELAADIETLQKRIVSEASQFSAADLESNKLALKAQETSLEEVYTQINTLQGRQEEIKGRLSILGEAAPKATPFANQLGAKYQKAWADKNTPEALFNDLSVGIDSISSGINGMVDNLVDATGSVEDFFRGFLGRTKEGKEAWREFGMSILKTMMKIVTDRITAQFMSILFGTAENPTKLATAGGGAIDFLLGMGKTAAMSTLGPSAAVGSGMNFNMASPSAPIPMMGAFAEGGKITGGLPNRDSVPIMAMAGEYILPKHTSSYLGEGFLEGLRSKPEATMRSFSGASAALGKGKSVNQSTNVYVVSPDKVPAGMSRDDVIVTIADDINRNGPIKQLIKQVNHRG